MCNVADAGCAGEVLRLAAVVTAAAIRASTAGAGGLGAGGYGCVTATVGPHLTAAGWTVIPDMPHKGNLSHFLFLNYSHNYVNLLLYDDVYRRCFRDNNNFNLICYNSTLNKTITFSLLRVTRTNMEIYLKY